MKKKIRKRELILFSVFIGLMLTSIIFNSSTLIDLNSNGDDLDEYNSDISKLPKTSGTQINITTPENDTYTGPMSGYYPGSHGFEDVADGSLPSDYVYFLGGTSPEPSQCGAQVVSYKTDADGNRHDKVIELKDYSSTSVDWIDAKFLQSGATDARNCTIEFYNLVNKDSGTFYRSNFGIKGDLGWIAHFKWYKWSSSGNPDIRYWDGATDFDSGIDQTYNRWYRYSIDISCDGGYAGLGANQWRFRVYDEDGTLVYTSAILDFEDDHPTGGPYNYRMTSSETQTTIREYIDAFGVTGLEDNYQIGDNIDEGSLLSFNNDTALDWMGYSLDGQENITISGNKTIPMPADGPHTIQVFGEDTLGTMVQSDVRHFTIITSSNPYINITTPENKTYTGPMSGYYHATHDYEHVPDGSLPDDYFYTLGGTDPEPSKCGAQIVSYKTDAVGNRHNKVLELRDYSTTSINWIRGNFLEPGSTEARNCTIEFYSLVNKVSGTFYQSSFGIRGDLGWIGRFQWYKWSSSGNPDIRYWDGATSFDSGIDHTYNRWYRYSIDISCDGGYAGLSANQWRFRIYNEDDTLIYTSAILDISIDHPTGGAYRYSMASGESQTTINQYVDAIGITGLEDNYQIGDNIDEGLLLSFNNGTALDWMGYSLDGQENITISGNKTIPMPADGPHTIQVFGEDTLGTMYESDVRYFTINTSLTSSNTYINITTPENKTYTVPMSGYYPATYGFENDLTGSGITPSDWSHWQPSQYGVYEDIGGHKKVYGIYKADALERRTIQTFTDGGQTTGTVEFYIRTDDATQTACYELYYQFSPPTYSWPLRILFNGGEIRVGNGTQYPILTNPESDRWYHVRIDFRMTGAVPYLGLAEDTMRVYLDDVDKGTFGCRGAYPSVNQIHVKNSLLSSGMTMYIDALGYSWDPNYNIGDNKEEGLLLSFNKGITPDWMGYSLDGQENVTILGNKTIPMPADGAHTIHVFGNDSLGTMYQSDMGHFSIDINSPISSISFTPHNGINEVNSTTLFTLSADDGLGSGVSAIMYKINDSGWIEYNTPFDLSGYDPGQYNISFYAFDLVGHIENINSLIVELVDIEAPISWITFIPHSGINQVNRKTNFSLFADDGLGSGVSAIRYKINDSDWIVYSIPFNLSGYDPGQYNISFYAFDLAGNIENINSLIVELVDIDAPISWIVFIPHSGINQVNRTTNFSLFADDDIGTGVSAIMYKIIDSGWIVYSIPFNLSGYDPGQYNISFYAFDLAGNIENINSTIVELVKIDTGPDITPGDDDDDDDDDDQGEDENVDFVLWFLIIPLITATPSVAGVAYVIRHKKKKESKLKKKFPDKMKLQAKKKGEKFGIIKCPLCNKITLGSKFCNNCGANLKEETIKIEDSLNKNVTINNLMLSSQNPEEIKIFLEKIFRNKEDRDLILSELISLPEGFFAKFKKSYEKSIKELKMEKSEYVNNDNYFDEGNDK